MEKFKIELFKQEHPNEKFPWFRRLPLKEQDYLVDNISLLLNISKAESALDLVKKLSDTSAILSQFNAEHTNFKLSSVLRTLDIIPKDKIFINWYQFDNIDQIYFKDLNKYFDSIWYPGPDDIDIFDESFSWVLSISHSGDVSIIQGCD